MPTTAQSIVRQVQREFNDLAGARAPASDIVPLLNMAQRDIQVARPDSTAVVATLNLAPGHRQALPGNAASLIDVHCNSTGAKRAIRRADMLLLDSLNPSWRTMPPAAIIQHWVYDQRNPRVFYVYPPADDGASVDMEASTYPIDVPPPGGNGRAFSTVTGLISLGDEFATALFCLTTYYVYLTDLEGVNNTTLASGFLQRAESLLGVELQTKSNVTAKT
jgi:hypothetical protein